MPAGAIDGRLRLQRAVQDGRGAGIFILATLRGELAYRPQVCTQTRYFNSAPILPTGRNKWIGADRCDGGGRTGVS